MRILSPILVLLLLLAAAPAAADTHALERPDGTTLTWYLDRPARSPFPIVAILQGSECLRVADKYGPYVERLRAEGVAVLRVEKPGLGPDVPIGECPPEYLELNTLDRRVLDLLEVAACLRAEPGWDGRLGLAGGSEGGVVAAVAAPLIPETRAVVLLASAGGITFGEEILLGTEAQMRAAGASDEAVAKELAAMRARFDEVRRRPLPDHEWLSDGKLARNTDLWWSRALPVAAVRSLLRVDAPILMVHGRGDVATPVQSAEALERAFREKGRTNLEFRYYEGGHAPPPEEIRGAMEWMVRHLSRGHDTNK